MTWGGKWRKGAATEVRNVMEDELQESGTRGPLSPGKSERT